jgi:DNA-directed RNA polymerase sigma subunit (sigma70/sigma32)
MRPLTDFTTPEVASRERGKTFSEIAATLHISESEVREIYRIALLKLRHRLEADPVVRELLEP